jgi:hypothetical protein
VKKPGNAMLGRSTKIIRLGDFHLRYQDKERRRVKMRAACILIRDATRQARHHAFPQGPRHNMPRMFIESEGGVGFKRGGRREERRSVLIIRREDLEVVLIRLCRF